MRYFKQVITVEWALCAGMQQNKKKMVSKFYLLLPITMEYTQNFNCVCKSGHSFC